MQWLISPLAGSLGRGVGRYSAQDIGAPCIKIFDEVRYWPKANIPVCVGYERPGYGNMVHYGGLFLEPHPIDPVIAHSALFRSNSFSLLGLDL